MNKKKVILLVSLLFIATLVFIVFKAWFGLGIISAGDAGFFFKQNLREYFQLPLSWESFRGLGLGGRSLPFLHWYLPGWLMGLTGFLFGFAWSERLIWLWPILLISFFSAYHLTRTARIVPINWWPICWLTLVLNSYFLMILAGGQITVALGFIFFPLIFSLFINIVGETALKFYRIVLFALFFSILLMFDPRFFYLFLLLVGFYFVIYLLCRGPLIKNLLMMAKKYLIVLLPSFVILVLLHFYWILPLASFPAPALPTGYGSQNWVDFLSFANFSDSLSLLHPNWPEDIFGKTYLMRPEFIFMPILGFASLLFINRKKIQEKRLVIFFTCLVLLGAFLAKGSKPPFGQVYLWFFNHLPGMSLFRDPTKFYTFTALGYSVLIPFSIYQGYLLVKKASQFLVLKKKCRLVTALPELFLFALISGVLFLVRPALLGQLDGAFKIKEIPSEYIDLKDYFEAQDSFFRVFWVPKRTRFGYYSNNHPGIDAEGFVTDSVCLEPYCQLKKTMPLDWGKSCFPNDRCYVRELSYFLNPKTQEVLRQTAVKYIIVPYDSGGELFIAERKYNPQQRQEVEEFLDTIPWLKKINFSDKMAIYEVSNPNNHFFIDKGEASIYGWQQINPTKYLVSIKDAQTPIRLVFSESFDSSWQARIDGKTILSTQFNQFNSFWLEKSDSFQITVEFAPQKFVNIGTTVSLLTLILVFGYLLFYRIQQAKA